MPKFPTIFVSHGMPAIVTAPGPTHDFLGNLGQTLGRPKAVVCVSAHWEAVRPMVTGTKQPETIHDFGGPPALFQVLYPTPGSPELAEEIFHLLHDAGLDPGIDPKRGLDHGAWVPLKLIFPEASIPVVQISVQTDRDPQHHFALGRALAPLREKGVLILGSGGATHNLPEINQFRIDSSPPDYAVAFDAWLEDTVMDGQAERLLNYSKEAPFVERNHPYPAEHFLPLFVPVGAAGTAPRCKLLHKTFMYGVLSMAAYAWE